MPCQQTVQPGQSEFDFFHQLIAVSDPDVCCGPLVPIGFLRPAVEKLVACLNVIGLDASYLDTFDHALVDSELLILTMCSKHWIRHIRAIGTVGEQHNDEWLELAYFMYKLMCAYNDWDYKEITNYTKTVTSIREKE